MSTQLQPEYSQQSKGEHVIGQDPQSTLNEKTTASVEKEMGWDEFVVETGSSRVFYS